MSWNNTKTRYGWLAIGFHWLMFLLIVAVYATMELKSIFPRGSSGRQNMALWHYMLGLSVFYLVWLRLLVRSQGSEPAIEPPPVRWQSVASRVMHWVLYVFMIGLPLLGWLTLSARGLPIPFFGLELPPLLAKNQDLARLFKDVHEAIATSGYLLIGMHAGAALYHHHIKRDNTLRRMLFGQ